MPNTHVVHMPPPLGIDKVLFAHEPMPARCRLERRIVWNLLQHLEAAGWHVTGVWDGEERTVVSSPEQAMELVFNLDDSHLYFAKVPYRKGHTVVVVLGNGVDCISDMSIGEHDGWTAAIDAFDAEVFA